MIVLSILKKELNSNLTVSNEPKNEMIENKNSNEMKFKKFSNGLIAVIFIKKQVLKETNDEKDLEITGEEYSRNDLFNDSYSLREESSSDEINVQDNSISDYILDIGEMEIKRKNNSICERITKKNSKNKHIKKCTN